MIYQFSANAWEDYLYWQEIDRKTLRRINRLIEDAARSPSEGIGKPEPLKHNLAGGAGISMRSIAWSTV